MNTSRIVDRTPAELEVLRKAYMRKPLSHLRYLAGILNLPTEKKKAMLVAAILTKCVKLIN